MKLFQSLLVILLALAGISAADTDFEYGSRPPNSVFDAAGVIPPERLKEISEPLVRNEKLEGVDIVVVVLPSLAGAPPEHVARQFSRAWCTSPIHAVVLHVPGEKFSPWIVPDGKLIDEVHLDVRSRSIADAQKRAMREPDDISKIAAAAVEASDMLRYWLANYINRAEVVKTERVKMRLDLERDWHNRKLYRVLAGALLVPLLLGISWLAIGFRPRGARLFPDRRPPRRLGAPHAGGNHAELDLGRGIPKSS
ncbi:MAG: TPM domain-containing protein [Akkermansiaceae bacterium]|nr:TPM domain-containing protein [Akkermansiaceae bacterium]MCP5543034.1 TPM domain-containing protein [Akkermansiaceae bacterium]